MKELSIFIDESDDFGEIKQKPAYYLVTMLYHNQAYDITENVYKLEENTRISGFDIEYIYTGSVIRREDVLSKYTINERRKLLYKMLNFLNSSKISHSTSLLIEKRHKTK